MAAAHPSEAPQRTRKAYPQKPYVIEALISEVDPGPRCEHGTDLRKGGNPKLSAFKTTTGRGEKVGRAW